jgi:outer membrane lipoprotein carrier protein
MQKYYLLVLLSSFFHSAMAQHQQEEAFALLDSISQRSFRATFVYTNRAQVETLVMPEEDGQIFVYGNKYRLMLPGQEVINDGQTVWTYLKEENEVQIADHNPDREAAMPWTIFSNYRRDYTLSCFDTHRKNGHVYDSLALIAKDEENSLCSVKITVARATKHIQCVEIVDNNQNLHNFYITDFAYDLTFAKDFFRFNIEAHQGIEIIDMR